MPNELWQVRGLAWQTAAPLHHHAQPGSSSRGQQRTRLECATQYDAVEAAHLHHHAAARVLKQVARLDGQRRQAAGKECSSRAQWWAGGAYENWVGHSTGCNAPRASVYCRPAKPAAHQHCFLGRQQLLRQQYSGSSSSGAAPEDGVPRSVRRKVHERAKGVARTPVVHVAHDGAQVRKLSLLHQVAHCGREGGRATRRWCAGQFWHRHGC